MKKTIKRTSKIDPAKQPSRAKQELKREKQKRTLKRVEKKLLAPTPDRSKQLETSKIKVNKLSHNPMFIEFLNWKGDIFSIQMFMDRLLSNFEKDSDRQTVSLKRSNLDETYLANLESFQKVFRNYLSDTISNQNVSDTFLAWLSNARNYIDEVKEYYLNDEVIKLSIKNPEGRWFESILCSNFILAFNYFGVEILKNCPVCKNFFCHKGPYARYCSEGCKETGVYNG